MDFKKGRFVKEQIKGTRVPFKFSTQMTSDGKIYMVGGYRLENSEQVPIRECVRINDYLETAQMDQLQMARFEIPLALVHDRFILALGGKKGKGKG